MSSTTESSPKPETTPAPAGGYVTPVVVTKPTTSRQCD